MPSKESVGCMGCSRSDDLVEAPGVRRELVTLRKVQKGQYQQYLVYICLLLLCYLW